MHMRTLPITIPATALIAHAPPKEKSRLLWDITKEQPVPATMTIAAWEKIFCKFATLRNLPSVVVLNNKTSTSNPRNGTAFFAHSAFFKTLLSFFDPFAPKTGASFIFISITTPFFPPVDQNPPTVRQINFSIRLFSVTSSLLSNSPLIVPSFMISILSDIPSSSGISSETIKIAFPSEINCSISL